MWWDTCVWCVVPGLYTVGASIDHLHQGCACVICGHVKNHIRLRDKYVLRHWQRRWLSLSVHFNQPLLLSCGCSLRIQLSGLGIMLFNMCVTFHHDLCCIFSNLVYFIHPGPLTALSSKHISWSHHLVWSVGWCHIFLGSAACGCVPLTYIWHTCIAMVYIAICVGCMSHMTCMTHICHGSADELDELITFSFLGWWRFILLGWTWLVRLSIIYIRVVHVL